MKQTPKKKVPVKKRRRRHAGPLCWLASLAVVALFGYFLFELVSLDILPLLYLVGICIVLILLTSFVLYFWLMKTRRPITRWLFGILSVALAVSYGIGGKYLSDTSAMLADVTNLTDKMVNVVSVYGLISKGLASPKDMKKGTTLGVVSQLDKEGTDGVIKQLKDAGAEFEVVEYQDPYNLVYDVIHGDVDTIALPEQLHDAVYEAANDENKFNALTTFTNILDQYIYYTDRTELMENPANPVRSVMTDPFVVLISGNDSYGTLNTVSRSDANMLAVINPVTAQVLIISLPRDTYMEVTCKKNPKACQAIAGQKDKLTHTGLYGVATTESSVEDFMDIEINYTARINFSSLINIVDAIGGIDVQVDPGLAVDRFYSNGTEGVHEGINHLNGERALAFARERYAYSDGDNQRIRNQQIVLTSIIKQMLSPSMVVNYPKVMTALSTAFETNMTARDLKALITLEITRFPKWNIQTYSLTNEPAMAYSPAAGAEAAITIASENEIEYARSLINTVLSGGVPDLSNPVDDNPSASSDMNSDLQNENEDQNEFTNQPAYQDNPYEDYHDDSAVSDHDDQNSNYNQNSYGTYGTGHEDSSNHEDIFSQDDDYNSYNPYN